MSEVISMKELLEAGVQVIKRVGGIPKWQNIFL